MRSRLKIYRCLGWSLTKRIRLWGDLNCQEHLCGMEEVTSRLQTQHPTDGKILWLGWGGEASVKEWNLPEMGSQTPQLRSDTFVFLLIRRIWPPGDPIQISLETVIRLRSTNWVDPISIASQGRHLLSGSSSLLVTYPAIPKLACAKPYACQGSSD